MTLSRFLLPALIASFIGGAAIAAQPPLAPPADPAAPPTPILQSPIEALEQDATDYARHYAVTPADALQRLLAQQESVAATDRLRLAYRDRFVGIVLEHTPAFRFVVVLTGSEPVTDDRVVAAGLDIPVVFQTGAGATHDAIVAAIEAHQAELAAALPKPPGLGVDVRAGALAVVTRPQDIGAEGAAALAARLGAIAGVPVVLRAWAALDTNLSVEGGSRLVGVDPELGQRVVCTSGFVVTDGTRTGVTTAAHCPDTLSALAPDGQETPLTMVDAWGARYQDVQIHVSEGQAFAPLFYADTARTRTRPVTSWRNRDSTRIGDVVCHRGERSGYSCAEVAFVDFAPPGALCFGLCPPTWVAVRGPDCHGGDSGGPVFSGTIAFGTVKGASYSSDSMCRLYYYMSTDYLPPKWGLLHR